MAEEMKRDPHLSAEQALEILRQKYEKKFGFAEPVRLPILPTEDFHQQALAQKKLSMETSSLHSITGLGLDGQNAHRNPWLPATCLLESCSLRAASWRHAAGVGSWLRRE